jgi:ABC-type polysaccharide/polyol phosphate transport system ATPase subunit
MSTSSISIQVEDLHKTFRVPKRRVHTLKERALHPFARSQFDEFHVLHGIDFEVLHGEFFGIVGRNGSGKSTLLKCLAGIYRADSGTIRVGGRLSPFIELGVGFNPELTARDNVMINAVMMGLTPVQARASFDDIIGFAELERFVELKLKNYSSGMQVRLAFSVMVQSDPDIMLIDEVLAVGDAAFQQKCIDVFYRLREQGKTIVLVTHEMGLVERFCHRAMMLKGGEIAQIGSPTEVGRAYLSENFQGHTPGALPTDGFSTVELLDAWVGDASGARVDAIGHGEQMALNIVLRANEEIREPGIALWVSSEEGVRVFAVGAREDGEALADIEAGERMTFTVELLNQLSAGRYHVGCSVTRGTAGLELLLIHERCTDLVSYGANLYGLVGVEHSMTVSRSRAAGVPR